MRRLCLVKFFCCIFLFFLAGLAIASPKSVGIFLYDNPPIEMFYNFDWVIVDPDVTNLDKIKMWEKLTGKTDGKIFAYLSISEVRPYRSYFAKIRRDWILGEDKAWHSFIVDLRKPKFQDILMERVKEIQQKGYDGLFLDTLDSYQMVLNQKEWASFEHAEIDFIKRIKKEYPHLMIITNRGFEIFDEVKDCINGFLVEGMFSRIDFRTDTYISVSKEERMWLLKKLKPIKSKRIPIIVVDYANLSNKKQVDELVKKIESLGFIPYISQKELNVVGVGPSRLLPRRVLLLYSSKVAGDVAYSYAHRLASLPLEYYGYIPELWDIDKGLPEGITSDRYTGIVVWIGREVKGYEKFHKWILNEIKRGIKVVFFDDFGFPLEERFLKPLGLTCEKNKGDRFGKIKEIYRDRRFVGFEIDPRHSYHSKLIKPIKGTPLLILKNDKGQEEIPVAITDFGGYALSGASVITIMGNEMWVVNPFLFLKKALRLKDIPAPDVTTENGRRILLAHMDGDGFPDRFEADPSKFAPEIIRDKILKRFRIPHTVSVIEGEIAPWGLYPKLSPKLEKIARSIFKLKNVEPASHTFSHPFKWMTLYRHYENRIVPKDKHLNLPIPNYTFNIKREIEGSINYINKRLLSGTGKKVKVLLWSGDCLPPAEAIKLTYQLGIYNVNGGDTTINETSPFLSNVSPMGLERGGYFQVYAPATNENVYTNLWRHPYYGYIKVIQTFKLTESPRRLKPIDIYYHFYSGSKIASLKALEKVYKWAFAQKVNPMYLSEYAKRVLNFRTTTISLKDGEYIIRGGSGLRTLRIPASLGFPDIRKSKGIVGYLKKGDNIYISLDGSGYYKLVLRHKKEPSFMLIDANGQVEYFKKVKGTTELKLKSYVPLEFSLLKPKNCRVEIKSQSPFLSTHEGNILRYKLEGTSATIEATCKEQLRYRRDYKRKRYQQESYN